MKTFMVFDTVTSFEFWSKILSILRVTFEMLPSDFGIFNFGSSSDSFDSLIFRFLANMFAIWWSGGWSNSIKCSGLLRYEGVTFFGNACERLQVTGLDLFFLSGFAKIWFSGYFSLFYPFSVIAPKTSNSNPDKKANLAHE